MNLSKIRRLEALKGSKKDSEKYKNTAGLSDKKLQFYLLLLVKILNITLRENTRLTSRKT